MGYFQQLVPWQIISKWLPFTNAICSSLLLFALQQLHKLDFALSPFFVAFITPFLCFLLSEMDLSSLSACSCPPFFLSPWVWLSLTGCDGDEWSITIYTADYLQLITLECLKDIGLQIVRLCSTCRLCVDFQLGSLISMVGYCLLNMSCPFRWTQVAMSCGP